MCRRKLPLAVEPTRKVGRAYRRRAAPDDPPRHARQMCICRASGTRTSRSLLKVAMYRGHHRSDIPPHAACPCKHNYNRGTDFGTWGTQPIKIWGCVEKALQLVRHLLQKNYSTRIPSLECAINKSGIEALITMRVDSAGRLCPGTRSADCFAYR
jgi:hypothetical protein